MNSRETMMKILVTSSSGLTGRAVVSALSAAGAEVRAMIHSESRRDEMLAAGAAETTTGSIESASDLRRGMAGVDGVFYICPTAHPREGEAGRMAVDIATEAGVKRFVYQSVLNSIEPALPHHRQKLTVEQYLLESTLDYSILRPAAFMQNLLAPAQQIVRENLFVQRFYTSADSTNRINLIDAGDYAEIAAEVITGSGYSYGSYDLCGPENLSARDMLKAMSEVTGRNVELRYMSDEEFINISRRNNMAESKIETLLAMFGAYNRYGFRGNPTVARYLLGRTPTDFGSFLRKTLGCRD